MGYRLNKSQAQTVSRDEREGTQYLQYLEDATTETPGLTRCGLRREARLPFAHKKEDVIGKAFVRAHKKTRTTYFIYTRPTEEGP